MKFNLEDTFYEQQKKDITCVHNFLNLKYKKPFGAIKKDEIVVLNISVPNNYNFQKITLLYKLDSEKFEEIPCKLIEISSEFSFYGTSLTLSQTGVYFYCFKIYFNEKDYLYLSCDNTKSKICEKENCFYMFCYNQDEKTINGKVYNNEIMYQIFPDRFSKSKYYEIGKAKNKRFIHENLNEKPQYIFDTDKYEATDFYLGNLKGITEKLTFIKTLGVSIIYLNPIFEAAANHRYNTADYFNIDPYLGTIDDFKNLCKKAKEYDIKIIIDGVFSHTGADSVYFNKFNHYNSIGAYQSTKSPFFSWYNFKGQNRDHYECWWGFKTLPNVNELDESYLDFICGENGVARFWLKMGADGWRLDVIDELPDEFLKEFRNA
ncbi:MAG: alpha-amylase family glycosyl hydrolase, partial [Oscillospiraceae bacterium]